MEGSAKIISLIARDENQHLVLTSNILNKWKQGDDPDMKKIAAEEEANVIEMFKERLMKRNSGQIICLKMDL